MKPVIGIDIDDVLAAHAEAFVAFSNEWWGTHLSVEDFDEHWAQVWQVDQEETERRADIFHGSGIIGRYRHYDEALPVLLELSKDFRLLAMTSRRQRVEEETRAWLDKHYRGIFEDIKFAGIWDDPTGVERQKLTKADLFVTNKVKFVIDDQLKHCVAAAEKGIHALLFGGYKWNQTEEHLSSLITRVADWAAVKDYFEDFKNKGLPDK